MQTFWSSMFTGNNAAAAAEEAGLQPAAEPPSKRARTTTIPSLPAPQDLQYIQNLCWASNIAAPAMQVAAAPVAVVPVGVVSNIPLAATSVPSSAMFLLSTPVMPDVANLSSSSNNNIDINNNNINNTKRTREDAIKAKQEERKRRNAENARVTRMRKKHASTLVDLELKALQRENEWLKNIVKREIPYDTAQQIINDCCYKGSEAYKHTTEASLLRSMGFDVKDTTTSTTSAASPARTGGALKEKRHEQLLGHSDFELLESLAKDKQSFVLSDPRQVDNPIVYASCSFLRLTGYTREQIIGRNCRFLQGIDTDPEQVAVIREAVESGKDGAACLINYKADGTPFWNHFFVTALRDKKNRIVNYVGVQTEVDKPLDGIEPMMPAAANAASAVPSDAAAAAATATTSNGSNPLESVGSTAEASLTTKLCRFEQEKLQRAADNTIDLSKLQELEDAEKNQKMPASILSAPVQVPMDIFDDTTDVNMIDWSQLAAVLEADFEDSSDFNEDFDIGSVDDTTTDNSYARSSNTAEDFETDLLFEKSYFSVFTKAPRELVILTIRSEIVDSMTRNDGDVSDPGFRSALELLSKMYHRDRSSSSQQQPNHDDIIHGQWREISRPTYQHGGIIGTNDRGDKVYSLGKMSFSMFKPGNLRVSVQSTINCIEPKADHKALPAAIPWSLRRELAQQGEQPSSSKLKSYDVVLAVTIEPGQFNAAPDEMIPSPSQRLRATYMVNGWFLPDPDTPNRLSVWFTGGQLSPVPTQQFASSSQSPHESFSEDTQHQQNNSSLDEWIGIFGAEHKRTWGEALSVMGAKLFLGAELPDGMNPDGTMSYTLHRPYGGHGRGYVDIMYADSEMLITKGNSGTVHVMVREDGTTNTNNNAGN